MQHQRPPPQGWKTFLINHAREIASVDFFTVPTAAMRNLYVLLVLSHDRRRILGFDVTDEPTGEWAAEQVLEAFEIDRPPTMLLRDQDRKFGDDFDDAMEGTGIQQVLSAYRSRGRTGMSSASLGPSAGNAWTT